MLLYIERLSIDENHSYWHFSFNSKIVILTKNPLGMPKSRLIEKKTGAMKWGLSYVFLFPRNQLIRYTWSYDVVIEDWKRGERGVWESGREGRGGC